MFQKNAHGYSVSRSQATTKMARVVSIVKTDLLLTICTMTNDSRLVQLLVCAVLVPGQLLSCPKEAVADLI